MVGKGVRGGVTADSAVRLPRIETETPHHAKPGFDIVTPPRPVAYCSACGTVKFENSEPESHDCVPLSSCSALPAVWRTARRKADWVRCGCRSGAEQSECRNCHASGWVLNRDNAQRTAPRKF